MSGIIIILFVSHLLLYYIFKGGIKMLGICTTSKDIKVTLLAFLCTLVFIMILHYSISIVVDNPYKINDNYSTEDFFNGIWYVIKSVVYEELVFRGALFYIVMKKLGVKQAIIISSIAFGTYHWFSFDVIGNPAKMAYTFINTGLMGYCLARSFVISKTILLPIAFHLSSNFVLMILLSGDKRIGQQLLVKSYTIDDQAPNHILGLLLLFLYYFGIPLLILIFLRFIKPWYDRPSSLTNPQ